MSEHTPGKLSLIGDQGTAMWSGDSIVAQINEPRSNAKLARANARRLVACWNACDGISTEDLESERSASTGWVRTASKLLKATTGRDSLRAVNAELLELLDSMKVKFRLDDPFDLYDTICAAIASARKQGEQG